MMNIERQAERGLLACPRTGQKLSLSEDKRFLVNEEKTERYVLHDGRIPILLADPEMSARYAHSSERMNRAYDERCIGKRESFLYKIKDFLMQDYRTEASKQGFLSIFENLSEDSLCLAVGGGPKRAHPRLFNLNIGPFPNVDIVGDAHCLPYADGSVDAVYSEAVFEHLADPVKAAEEIYRVLKPGGKGFICTPFLQAYHGFPFHFQNFTLTGHQHLFTSVGFKVVGAGACVGPTFMLVRLIAAFINEYFPFPLDKIFKYIWGVTGMALAPLDKILGERPNAHILASATYVTLLRED